MQRVAQGITSMLTSLASILAKLPALGTAGTASTDVITTQGAVPSASAASGNPLPIAGVYKTTLPTYTDGQQGVFNLRARGALAVNLMGTDAATGAQFVVASDGRTAQTALEVDALMSVFNGATTDRLRTSNVFKRFSALGSGAEVTVWTPTSGKKFRLMRGIITSSVAGDVDIRDNTSGTIILTLPVTAGVPTPFDLGNGILSAAANNVLTADAPGAGTLSGYVGGTEE
jgi:hypothetical protein